MGRVARAFVRRGAVVKRPHLVGRVGSLRGAPAAPGSTSEPDVIQAFRKLEKRADGELVDGFRKDRTEVERHAARVRARRATDRGFDRVLCEFDRLGKSGRQPGDGGPRAEPN